MTRICCFVVCAALTLTGLAPAMSPETEKALSEISALQSNVKGYKADMEVHDKRGKEEQVATSTIEISKDYGWKLMNHTRDGDVLVTNDFTTQYVYSPSEKKVMKSEADSPEMKEAYRKPASELNFVAVLDPETLKLVGKEEFEGEPVYHFEGTTTTQLMKSGKPFKTKIEAWISTKDGLTRKTVEYAEGLTGTTIYRNVQLNPGVTAKDFTFTPPKGAEIVDLNQPAPQATKAPKSRLKKK